MSTQKIKIGYIDSGSATANQTIVYDGANVIWSNIVTYTSDVFDATNAAFSKANTAGGGYFQGNNGDVASFNFGDIFRTHSNTLTGVVTVYTGNNSIAAGPIIIANTGSLIIQPGARVVIT